MHESEWEVCDMLTQSSRRKSLEFTIYDMFFGYPSLLII
jgi:hypothetical protein